MAVLEKTARVSSRARATGLSLTSWVLFGSSGSLAKAVMAAGWYEHNLGDGEVLTLFLGAMGCGYAAISPELVKDGGEESKGGAEHRRR